MYFSSLLPYKLCTAVTFRPNNHRELWSGGMDCTVIAREFPTANSLNSWDFANDAAGSSTPSINPPFVYSLKFTPDGDALAVGRGDGGISFIEFLKHTATTPASSAASKKSSNKKKKKRKALNDVYVVSKTAADDGEVMKQDSRRIVEECRLKGALKEFPRSVKATSTRELNLVDVIHGWSIVAM